MASKTSTSYSLVTNQNIIRSWNRGPIESIFVHPASCTDTLTLISRTGGNNHDFYFGHHGTPVSAECYPTGTRAAPPLNEDSAWRGYYYSPAICPSGWISVTTFMSSVPYFPPPHYFALGPETTAVLCCPNGYEYHADGCQCKSTITVGETVTLVLQTFDGQNQTWVRGSPITNTILSTTVVLGDGVPIMWQSKDAEALARAFATTPTVQTNTVMTTSETTKPSNTFDKTDFPSSGDLSMGMKIGIGVSIPIAIIAGFALGFFVWKRRRAHQTEHEGRQVYNHSEINTENKNTPAAPTHSGDEQAHEIFSTPEVYHSRHELPAVAHHESGRG